jgi:hypothetical protein
MSKDANAAKRRAIRAYWFLIAVQWLLLTLGLAGVMTRSAIALEDYVSPNLSEGWLAVASVAVGLLMGLTVLSPKALVPLVLSCCLAASVTYGLVIYLPAWQGTLFRSTTFANYAQQQGLLFFIWTSIPAVIGAIAGYLVSGEIRRALEQRRDGPDSERLPWWERAGEGTETPDAGRGTRGK